MSVSSIKKLVSRCRNNDNKNSMDKLFLKRLEIDERKCSRREE